MVLLYIVGICGPSDPLYPPRFLGGLDLATMPVGVYHTRAGRLGGLCKMPGFCDRLVSHKMSFCDVLFPSALGRFTLSTWIPNMFNRCPWAE